MLRSLLQVIVAWAAVSLAGGFLWILLVHLVPKWHKMKAVRPGEAPSENGRQLSLPY
jgi:hypothetical protein